MLIIVIYILVIILCASIKKVNAYDAFLEGASSSFKTLKNLFPSVLAMIFAINVFTNSGIFDFFTKVFKSEHINILSLLQIFIKPISWSSSLVLMQKIFDLYGVNSKIGILATLIQGSSDTAIYVVALYFSSIKMQNTSHTTWVSILASFVSFLACGILVWLFF